MGNNQHHSLLPGIPVVTFHLQVNLTAEDIINTDSVVLSLGLITGGNCDFVHIHIPIHRDLVTSTCFWNTYPVNCELRMYARFIYERLSV